MSLLFIVVVLIAIVLVGLIIRNIILSEQLEKLKLDASFDPSLFARPRKLNSPDWVKNAVIYQVNVRQFSKKGNFAEVEKQLPRLADLGVDVLWLMPIYPICIRERKCHPEATTECLGSPYAPYDFFSINPDFGSPEDLRTLIAEAHDLGMKIILDFVPNHTGWDSRWMLKHPEWFVRDAAGNVLPVTSDQGEIWGDIAQFDLKNKKLRENWMQVHEFWVKNFDIDGYREDCAWAIAPDWWLELRQRLNKIKPIYMLAEDEVHGLEQFNVCFETNYGWGTHHVLKQIAKKEKPASALFEWTESIKQRFGTRGWQLNFTQNHDENTWHGTETELFSEGAEDCYTALTFIIEGTGLIYNGQEASLDKRLWFFNKDEIDWSGKSRAAFFKALTDLKHRNRALWNGENGGFIQKIETGADASIYAFGREKRGDRVVGIFNMTDEKTNFILRGSKFVGAFKNVLDNSAVELVENQTISFKPFEFLILTNK